MYRSNLGLALLMMNDVDAAAAAFTHASRLDASNALAHYMLGQILEAGNDSNGAIAELHEAARLRIVWAPAYLELADLLCQRGESFQALEVLRDVAKVESGWMAEPTVQLRCALACCAALAGTGRGQDVPPEMDRELLRSEALECLSSDLEAWEKRASDPSNKALVNKRMNHWLGDKDLEGVRSDDDLAHLSADEREAWERLWTAVRNLRDTTAPPGP
ncbi:MAG TPA: hypothetical protein VGX78_01405 [Pirellulales bacterium]|jgi:tetratricopeptide (TPR) repeat protein|nr:hypothetical protein [Pirellulales bacterium]